MLGGAEALCVEFGILADDEALGNLDAAVDYDVLQRAPRPTFTYGMITAFSTLP